MLSNKTLLQASDFEYLGYYQVDLGGEFSYGQGLAHRYVGGQLRFLALSHSPNGVTYQLREFAAPASPGGTVSTITDQWTDIWNGRHGTANGSFIGLWWDEAGSRLWSTAAIDYPTDEQAVRTQSVAITSLLSGGAIANVKGLYGLDGIGSRRIYGGVTRVPTWFQDQFGTPPYALGFGGYTSRLQQGLTGSMGPVLYAVPDVSVLADGANVPAGQFRVLMDHSSGNAATDWYSQSGAQSPSQFDRGQRTGDYSSYYDGGVYPSQLGQWQMAPDGRGRWTWGDSAYQTGVWIDLDNKHGFVLIPTVHTGNVWYQNSTLNWNGRTAEFQVFDPNHFGEVVTGAKQPWQVQPTHIWRPSWQATLKTGGQGNAQNYTACAATYDSVSRRLFVRWTFAAGNWPYTKDRIFIWQVG